MKSTKKNRFRELNSNPKRSFNDFQMFIIPLFTIITNQVLPYYSRIAFFLKSSDQIFELVNARYNIFGSFQSYGKTPL